MTRIPQNAPAAWLAALAVSCLLAPRLAVAAQEVVNVQFDNATGIVDLQLLRDGNKIVSGFAIESQRNTPWLAKTDQLAIAADGRIAGTITLTQTPDLLALQGLRKAGGNKDAKAPPVLIEDVSLDVVPKDGRVEGTVTPAKAKTALLGAKADPVAVRGSVYPQASATESLIELIPFGVNAGAPSSQYDMGQILGGLSVRMRVSGGKIERAKAVVMWPWPMTSIELPAIAGQAVVAGDTLKGAVTLTKTGKLAVEGVLRYEGTIIGDYAVGLATWESGGVTDETAFRARVSRYQPFPSLLVGDRTWEPNGKPLEPDAALAAKAREESLQPIRPGDPAPRAGAPRPFYSTRPIHLNKYFALHAPTIAFSEVPGAVKYRIDLTEQVPPKPLPILRIAPDEQYRLGKGVRATVLKPDAPPTAWLASDTIPGFVEEDPLTDLGGAQACRPESGSAFRFQGREYRFRPPEDVRLTPDGSVDLAALGMKKDTVVLFTVLENTEVRHVRWRTSSIGRARVEVILAGRKLDPRQILRLEKGIYPLLVIVRKASTSVPRPMLGRLEAVGDEELRNVEQELAQPAPRLATVSFEADKPWRPLTPLWNAAPAGAMLITATALDAAGKEIGQAELPGKAYTFIGGDPLECGWTRTPQRVPKDGKREMPGFKNGVPVMKMATFAGPYWAPNRTAKEAALAAARALRDQDGNVTWRNVLAWGNFTGGDGGHNPSIVAFARACAAIATWSDDAEERRDALTLAERAAWMVYGTHRGGRLPKVYKDNVCLRVWIGLAYLDVYAVGKDERFRDAAIDLARAFAAAQDPEEGGWPGRDKATGMKFWPGGTFGPSELRTNGGEAVLWFLGRVRRELGVEEFVRNEDQANTWVQTYCLPEMFWQNVGYHSREMILVQDTVAAHALAYCTWQLDYADAKAKDLNLVMEIARWCEERHVNWQRQPDRDDPLSRPSRWVDEDGKPRVILLASDPDVPQSRPSCWGWNRAAGTGIRVAGSLVYVWTRLWQETKDPLWKAKGDALTQSILVSQDPLDGGLPYNFQRVAADTTGGHTYDMIDAACRLMDYSRLTAERP